MSVEHTPPTHVNIDKLLRHAYLMKAPQASFVRKTALVEY